MAELLKFECADPGGMKPARSYNVKLDLSACWRRMCLAQRQQPGDKMLIDKKLPTPMYPTDEMGKRSKRNHWFVKEKGSDQPHDQSWYDWWKSRSLGLGKNGHIAWRSTCIARNTPDPFNPPDSFEVEFKAPDGKLYHLEFKLAQHGPNK